MYKVLADFADMHDNGHLYRAGDIFPRVGVDVKDVDRTRLMELSSSTNRFGTPLIEEAMPVPLELEKPVKMAENASEDEPREPEDEERPRKRRRSRPQAGLE